MIPILGLSLKALKKEPFSGSHRCMRYYLAADGDSLAAYIYPEPWCFEATPEDKKTKEIFPFTQEGLDSAVDWIEERFQSDRIRWENISKDKMKILMKG